MRTSDEDNELPNESYRLTQGPLPKSRYTYELEEIARQLMKSASFKFTKEGHDDFITVNDIKYNWTDIIKYANLDHIEFDGNDFYLYSQFMKSPEATVRSNLQTRYEKSYREALYTDYYLHNLELPETVISFQEMQAINIYTSNYYKNINALLRGEFKLGTQTEKTTRQTIIQSVMCASGLRRIPQTPITDAYRGAKMPSRDELDKYIYNAEKHRVIELSGFVSSSIENTSSFQGKPLEFHFTNLKGVYVAPISQNPGELEFLIPPTQVQLTNYTFDGGRHYFEGRIVSDLAMKETESLEMHSPSTTLLPHPEIELTLSKITSYQSLYDVLRTLRPEECRAVSKAKKALISSPEQFTQLMEFLSSKQRQAVYDTMMQDNTLVHMIQNESNIAVLLQFLSPTQSSDFMNAMKERLPEIIPSFRALRNLFQSLTPNQCKRVSEMMSEQLPSMIQSISDLSFIQEHLSDSQFIELFDTIKVQLFTLTQSIDDFVDLLDFLKPEQRTMIYKLLMDQSDTSLMEQLLEWIEAPDQLGLVMSYLTTEQCTEVCHVLKDNGALFIKSTLKFFDMLQPLTSEQRIAVYTIMKEMLPDILVSSSAGELSDLLGLLPEQESTEIMSVKNLISNLTKSLSSKNACAFASALISDDKAIIHTQFNDLLEKSRPLASLITTLAELEPQWVKKISEAMELNLSDTQLNSSSDIETRIAQYVADKSRAITQHYKQTIVRATEDDASQDMSPKGGVK